MAFSTFLLWISRASNTRRVVVFITSSLNSISRAGSNQVLVKTFLCFIAGPSSLQHISTIAAKRYDPLIPVHRDLMSLSCAILYLLCIKPLLLSSYLSVAIRHNRESSSSPTPPRFLNPYYRTNHHAITEHPHWNYGHLMLNETLPPGMIFNPNDAKKVLARRLEPSIWCPWGI